MLALKRARRELPKDGSIPYCHQDAGLHLFLLFLREFVAFQVLSAFSELPTKSPLRVEENKAIPLPPQPQPGQGFKGKWWPFKLINRQFEKD